MACLRPIQIRNKKYPHESDEQSLIVPCGKCDRCLKRRASQWIFRLQQELKGAVSAFFLTLTYNEEEIPLTKSGDQTLKKRDLQLFMKKLRTQAHRDGWSHKIKYYACGEYGGKTNRPHYHIILFNAPPAYMDFNGRIESLWTQGLCHIGSVTDGSIGYVTGYVLKKSLLIREIDDERQKEFAVMSKKLGANYLTEAQKNYKRKTLTNYVLTETGSKIAMPRYYSDKIFDDEMKEFLKDETESYLETIPELEYKRRIDIIKHEKQQAKKEHITKRSKI